MCIFFLFEYLTEKKTDTVILVNRSVSTSKVTFFVLVSLFEFSYIPVQDALNKIKTHEKLVIHIVTENGCDI